MDLRRLTFLRPGLLACQTLANLLGFQLIYSRVRDIPDAEMYGPTFQPWRTSQWRSRLNLEDGRSLLTPEARYYLYSLATDAKASCTGAAAECGVYRGGSAKILANIYSDRELLLFDTFQGMPETDAEKDLHRKGDFADTSLESVMSYVGQRGNISFVAGRIPDTLTPFADRTFSFVHIDLDIYDSVKAACEFFYPRMERGGIMIFDDYGVPSCPGERQAVDEFAAAEMLSPMILPTGQCFVRRTDQPAIRLVAKIA